MRIQVNERGEITGYAVVGGFPEGAEIEEESLPEGFEEEFRPGKYLLEEGEVHENPAYEEPEDITPVLEEIEELKGELSATDYKALKYMEGWLTQEEYAPIKAQRQQIRDRINELETVLKEKKFPSDAETQTERRTPV